MGWFNCVYYITTEHCTAHWVSTVQNSLSWDPHAEMTESVGVEWLSVCWAGRHSHHTDHWWGRQSGEGTLWGHCGDTTGHWTVHRRHHRLHTNIQTPTPTLTHIIININTSVQIYLDINIFTSTYTDTFHIYAIDTSTQRRQLFIQMFYFVWCFDV